MPLKQPCLACSHWKPSTALTYIRAIRAKTSGWVRGNLLRHRVSMPAQFLALSIESRHAAIVGGPEHAALPGGAGGSVAGSARDAVAELGHQLAMHIVAMKPPYVSRTEGGEAAAIADGGGPVACPVPAGLYIHNCCPVSDVHQRDGPMLAFAATSLAHSSGAYGTLLTSMPSKHAGSGPFSLQVPGPRTRPQPDAAQYVRLLLEQASDDSPAVHTSADTELHRRMLSQSRRGPWTQSARSCGSRRRGPARRTSFWTASWRAAWAASTRTTACWTRSSSWRRSSASRRGPPPVHMISCK